MSVDLRGFRYRLEPARRLADWRLTGMSARLGELQRSIDEVTRRIADLDAAYDAQARWLADGLAAGCDPSRYAAGLQWISRLHRERSTAQATKDEWLAQRRRLRSELAMQQARVDAFDAHREACQNAYATGEASRQAAEADRDWLARLAPPVSSADRGGPYGN
ncbi:hypothetical protein [Trinickia diaoshuihuensis]|jgi:flagellar biosynthesis chaperone FliJ|uniref:hypothetical protein n=1 Tax=Trinickia diaoshuihuensis TaxID=2292265 RepID=UPI0013C33B20|nr:hypothetical protein [Trinickia diaoshuihuensis]